MPYYPGLKNKEFSADRSIVIDNILRLKQGLSEIPEKTLDKNVLVATWNLRDFGRNVGTGFNPEERFGESFYYIAEIISHFDIIAIQEINEDMKDFKKLMRILGIHYDFISTDVTEGRGGNDERMVFVYDKRKINFLNIAGEIVLPPTKSLQSSEVSDTPQLTQFARTPFNVSFQCGWFKFDLCTAHLYYGETSGEKYRRRVEEIRLFSEFMFKRAEKYKSNTFILGDFNVVDPQDDTWKALEKSGFTIPKALLNVGSNIDQEKYYDQIAFHSISDSIKIEKSPDGMSDFAGKFNFLKYIFTESEKERYIAKSKAPDMVRDSYRKWSTWQISDHLPLWICIKTDFSTTYLNNLK